MSVWEFTAAVEGWVKAHDSKSEQKLSKDEQDEIWGLINPEA
jgi:hypothetical protein